MAKEDIVGYVDKVAQRFTTLNNEKKVLNNGGGKNNTTIPKGHY